jgi:glycine/D-amino acid oxidase-like deaminating enzyme
LAALPSGGRESLGPHRRARISCGKVERGSLLLAGNDLGAGGLRAEAEARRAAGLYAEYLTRARLQERFGIARAGAILSPGNLALDPRQLTAGLLLCAIERGARCHAPTKATIIEAGRDRVAVATADGPVISAAHVILATGYELMELVPTKAHAVISTWAIATRAQPRAPWPEEALIWESSDYLYLICARAARVASSAAARTRTSQTMTRVMH